MLTIWFTATTIYVYFWIQELLRHVYLHLSSAYLLRLQPLLKANVENPGSAPFCISTRSQPGSGPISSKILPLLSFYHQLNALHV